MPLGLLPPKEEADESSDDDPHPDAGGDGGGKMKRPAAAAAGAADVPPKKKKRKSAADTEAEMMAKYVSTKEKRAKERADKKRAELLKRPAAAPAPKAKLGKVGKALAIKYKVKWEAGDEHRSRNVFNCKHYNRAKTVVSASYPAAKEGDRQATLADVVVRSSKVFDKHNA